VTGPLPPLPHLPVMRLRQSRGDLLLRLIERQPAWAHVAPSMTQVVGGRGVANYRLTAESFFLQVHWRWHADGWQERDVDVVPGAVVALRLVLDDLAPERVTRALGLSPTRAFAKGETGPRGRGLTDEGLWIHEVLPGGFHFAEEKVAELLAVLRGRVGFSEVMRSAGIRWAGVTVKLRGCLERMGGFVLEPRLLEDLVGLSLPLDLDLAAD
jgi:hypothetical protein